MVEPPLAPAPAGNAFPDTRWTLVLAAKHQPERRRQAFEELVRPRYKALYAIARKRGLSESEAQDAVQGFLTQLLEGDLLARLDPEKGRLRSYLKTALSHYLSNLWQRERAEKRGSGQASVDLTDVEAWLQSKEPSPEACFDRAWALEMFQGALQALELEFRNGRRGGPFELIEELFGFDAAPPYEELSRRYGMTVPQLKSFVHRTRVRLRQLLRERVADTLTDAADIELEIAALLEAMAA